MKYVEEYRNKDLVEKLLTAIRKIPPQKARFMEVCGGHTMAIQKFGIPSLLPKYIELVSGPGCPVCVTANEFIDKAIAYAELPDTIIATYGDLMRVPGSSATLNHTKASGADVRIIFSPMDALKIAQQQPDKKVIFLGIGFETTAPGTAATIKHAFRNNTSNFLVLSAHKLMPPAMRALIDEKVRIDGYLAPGHVCTITGSSIFNFIAADYHIPVVVAGFEPCDILQSVYQLLLQQHQKRAAIEIQYKRAVSIQGNLKAQQLLYDVFETSNEWWRGLGVLSDSGLKIKAAYHQHDASHVLPVKTAESKEPKGCLCGAILKGIKKPTDCHLFGKACLPENPVGACMVSNEGSCHAYYKYNQHTVV